MKSRIIISALMLMGMVSTAICQTTPGAPAPGGAIIPAPSQPGVPSGNIITPGLGTPNTPNNANPPYAPEMPMTTPGTNQNPTPGTLNNPVTPNSPDNFSTPGLGPTTTPTSSSTTQPGNPGTVQPGNPGAPGSVPPPHE